MIYLIRHGERTDDPSSLYDKKLIKLTFDPALTQKGIDQAQKSAIHIQNISKQMELSKKYFVVSSPFLRCVQTAIAIQKQLGFQNIHRNQVFIMKQMGECLSTDFFDRQIMPELTIYNQNRDDLNYDILQNNQLIQQKFPENYSQFFTRFHQAFEYINIYFVQNFDISIYDLIIVTHGYGLQAISNQYPQKRYDYCSIVQMQIQNIDNQYIQYQQILLNKELNQEDRKKQQINNLTNFEQQNKNDQEQQQMNNQILQITNKQSKIISKLIHNGYEDHLKIIIPKI